MRPIPDPEPLQAEAPPRELVTLWLAVLAGPLLLLWSQETKYAMVGWACRAGHELMLHATSAVTLILVLMAVLVAAGRWRDAGGAESTDAPDRAARTRFFAAVGFMLGGLSALVVTAQWLPQLFYSPCQPLP